MSTTIPKEENFILFVPRQHYHGQKQHVRVKLALVNDRPDLSIIKQPILLHCTDMLAEWKVLPDNCEVIVTISDILRHILRKSPL